MPHASACRRRRLFCLNSADRGPLRAGPPSWAGRRGTRQRQLLLEGDGPLQQQDQLIWDQTPDAAASDDKSSTVTCRFLSISMMPAFLSSVEPPADRFDGQPKEIRDVGPLQRYLELHGMAGRTRINVLADQQQERSDLFHSGFAAQRHHPVARLGRVLAAPVRRGGAESRRLRDHRFQHRSGKRADADGVRASVVTAPLSAKGRPMKSGANCKPTSCLRPSDISL